MSGRVTLLSVLLALQLVIIAVVLLAETGFGDEQAGPFLSFEQSSVDEIRITGDGEDAETLVLSRGEHGWQLPDGMPADANKVSEVLGRLSELQAPWPVATSGNAAERFEVTDDTFQRHVVLLADGDAVTDLYLGTSPGYQQVHARRAGDDAVYSVGLSNYQLPNKADDWLDKTLLQPKGEVSAVARQGDWQLERDEEGWLIDESAADRNAADDLVRRVKELRILGVAEAPPADAEPTEVLEITDEQGVYVLSIYGDEEGNQYRVRSDRRDGTFELASYIAEQLLVEEQTLVAAKDESEQDESADAAPGGGVASDDAASDDGPAADPESADAPGA